MPRKEAKSVKAEDAEEEEGQGGVCYLDTFLNSITETHDLPREFKANLATLRDLDSQAQEMYERMTKQQKNHISRGKRAIQGGHDVDDEQLVKARRSHRELMAIGESKAVSYTHLTLPTILLV